MEKDGQPPTGEWSRIGDEELIHIGTRTLHFTRSDTGEKYEVVLDEAMMDEMVVRMEDYISKIIVQDKRINPDGIYAISGELEDKDKRILETDGNWCELILYPSAIANYWGTARVIRSDHETARS